MDRYFPFHLLETHHQVICRQCGVRTFKAISFANFPFRFDEHYEPFPAEYRNCYMGMGTKRLLKAVAEFNGGERKEAPECVFDESFRYFDLV